MKLAKRTQYALRALADIAASGPRDRVQADQLARRHGMPARYLEQVLLSLTNAGILHSQRGAGGGYSLARPPEGISLGEVIQSIEGEVVLLDCVDGGKPEECTCSHRGVCGLSGVVGDLSRAMGGLMSGVTLADVRDRSRSLREAAADSVIYSI